VILVSKVKNFHKIFFFTKSQWCHFHCWNDFRGVNYTAEIYMTPLNLKQTLLVIFLQWQISPYYTSNIITEKSWDLPRPHFLFQRCQWHQRNRFRRLSKWLSWRIWCHMQNSFSLLIRDLYGGWLMKKPRVKNLWHCLFN
jgi:hypothetical protein